MPANLDCIPCLCRATVRSVRAATDDPSLQDAVLGEALFHLAMRDPSLPPRALAADLQALISRRTGRTVSPLTDQRHCPHAA